MVGNEFDGERKRLAQLATQLTVQRGIECTRAMLSTETGLARARIEAIFPDEGDLFDATVEHWYAPDVAMMEEVLASDLPPNRKFYEFFARRFAHNRAEYRKDPAGYAFLCELGTARFERVRSYIDLADHYLCELIAEAQAEGAFEGLAIERARSLINQLVICYTQPQLLMMLDDRLSEDKLAAIVDTLFAGLSDKDRGSRGIKGLRAA